MKTCGTCAWGEFDPGIERGYCEKLVNLESGIPQCGVIASRPITRQEDARECPCFKPAQESENSS